MNTSPEESVPTDFRLLIGGRLVEGTGTLDVINPATGRILTTAPAPTGLNWGRRLPLRRPRSRRGRRPPFARGVRCWPGWPTPLDAEKGAFARLLTREQGKPLPEAMWEIDFSVAALRYYAALDLPPEVVHEDAARTAVRLRKPLGVVAAITAWNFPMILLAIKVGPALVAGNTVVAKPAPTTPLTTLMFGELCARVLPPGVVNVIVDRNDLGAALTAHPDVAKVAFTGSTATGRKVMAVPRRH